MMRFAPTLAADRLYHLAEDPAELVDLTGNKPDKLTEMAGELEAIIAKGRSR